MPVFAFTAGSLGDIMTTAGLVAQVVKVLYDNKSVANECEDLATELQSLQSVLILTEKTLERYSSTPLGEILAHFIRPEVAQCHLSLERFYDNITNFQRALSTKTIASLWRRMVWIGSDEAATLSARLSSHRLKLATLLISLNSARQLDMESVQITKMQANLYNTINGLSSTRRIKDNTIEVVDPLGDTMPISILFCATWEAFHYVLKGYSRRRIGQHYIDQGDYQIIRPESGDTVQPSEFSRAVKEGDIVEISIILRSRLPLKRKEGLCPRCSLLNAPDRSDGGWIRCQRCSCRFQTSVRAEDKSDGTDGAGNDTAGRSSNHAKTKSTLRSKRKKSRQVPDVNGDPSARDAKFFRRISLEVYVQHRKLRHIDGSLFHNDFIRSAKLLTP